MQSDPTLPENHVALISPGGGRLAVEIGSADEKDLRSHGWRTQEELDALESAIPSGLTTVAVDDEDPAVAPTEGD